ncbi:hypothetical protein [uncultured Nocardioides sp.]|uniref:hypothetical protein n=1 Tax=uncultured Nocardioides sp. TaxID=198441 RepID=UPI0025F8B219|nr:hypothetical protein [uncultured Nocardioides sp.]
MQVRSRAALVGLLVALLVVAASVAVPQLAGWDVVTRRDDVDELPPLHGFWRPSVAPMSVVAVLLAGAAWRWAPALAQRLSWRGLLLASYAAGLAWLLVLALVDGTDGISRALGNPFEYLGTARDTDDVGLMLRTFIDRIPYTAEDNWVTHVAGHPPGALLFFVGLVRIGLGGDLAAGLVVTAIAATTALAVMSTVRTLGSEAVARTAAPFLVFTPAAVFMAVSADALFAAVAAWGLCALAVATRARGRRWIGWAGLAGLLLGACVFLSYGLPLLGLLALAVLVLGRSWRPLPVAVLAALAVVAAFAVAGFAWWEAYPVLVDRYWDGVAAERPQAYWVWGNLGALLISAGPLLGAGIAHAGSRRRRTDRTVLLLAGAALAAVVVADLSRMSKSEVERIWLPFIPWLTLTTAALPTPWRRWGLALQLATALVVQHLLYTSW